MKDQGRLQDLHVYQDEKTTKKGTCCYYWRASWWVGDRARNVHLGSCRKMSQAEALQKARAMKAAALAINL